MKTNRQKPTSIAAEPLFKRPELLIEELLSDGMTQSEIERAADINAPTLRRILNGASDIRLSTYQALFKLHKERFSPEETANMVRKARRVRELREEVARRARANEPMPEIEV